MDAPVLPMMLTAPEVALWLSVPTRRVEQMARNGEIMGVQVGRLWRFRASVLNEWLEHKMAS